MLQPGYGIQVLPPVLLQMSCVIFVKLVNLFTFHFPAFFLNLLTHIHSLCPAFCMVPLLLLQHLCCLCKGLDGPSKCIPYSELT